MALPDDFGDGDDAAPPPQPPRPPQEPQGARRRGRLSGHAYRRQRANLPKDVWLCSKGAEGVRCHGLLRVNRILRNEAAMAQAPDEEGEFDLLHYNVTANLAIAWEATLPRMLSSSVVLPPDSVNRWLPFSKFSSAVPLSEVVRDMHVQLNSAPLKSLQLLVLDSNFAERYINNFDAKWIVSPKVWLRHAGIDASSVEAVAAPDGGATPVGGPPLPDQELLCGGANSIRTSRGATRSQFKVEPILIAWEMFTSIKDPTRTNLESLLKQVMDRCRGGSRHRAYFCWIRWHGSLAGPLPEANGRPDVAHGPAGGPGPHGPSLSHATRELQLKCEALAFQLRHRGGDRFGFPFDARDAASPLPSDHRLPLVLAALSSG